MYEDFDLLAELAIAYSRRKLAKGEYLKELFNNLDIVIERGGNVGVIVLILKEIRALQAIERRIP